MNLSENEKKEKENNEVINKLKEIYYNLFIDCKDEEDKWEYEESFENLLDIISMMS